MIDEKIGEMRGAFGEIGDQRLVVMAALTIADNLVEARDAARRPAKGRKRRTRARPASPPASTRSAQIEALAERLAGGAEA